MGNILQSLTRYLFDRRENEQAASRSQPNHPERLPPDNFTTVTDTERKSILTSSSATTSEVVAITATTIPTKIMSMTNILIETMVTQTSTEAMSMADIPIDAMVTQISTAAMAPSNRCSDFYLACRNNNIETVKELLETITLDDIDRLEPNGSTALHTACYHGHREIVHLLLEAGADRAIHNKYQYLPYDEAANDEIKHLFLRVPNSNRLVSNTGAIEWELIDDDVLEKAEEERHIIKSLYDKHSSNNTVNKMFEKIENNYINNGLCNFTEIYKIKRFFQKATKEQDPRWIIKAYTAETDFYQILNQEVAGGAGQYQMERRYIIALLWHHPILDDLAYIGRAYRVVDVSYNDLQKYQINSSLMTKSFLSSSIDQKIAELFICQRELAQEQTKISGRTKIDGTLIKLWVMCVYHIKHRRTSLHIENSSQYTNEGEILIMPYTVFKIKRIDHIKSSSLSRGQAMTEIELEECDQYSTQDT